MMMFSDELQLPKLVDEVATLLWVEANDQWPNCYLPPSRRRRLFEFLRTSRRLRLGGKRETPRL
jgi:hypothetical protein